MPSPLWNTLNFRPAQRGPNMPSVNDPELGGYLSDGDVADMQEADLNDQAAYNSKLPRNPITNEARGTISLRSANDTRQQGMSALRRTVGLDRFKTQNVENAEHARAQDTLALEKSREGSAERIATTNANAKANDELERFMFQAQQGELNRNAVNERAANTLAGVNGRAANVQGGQNDRLARTQAEARAKALETQAGKVGGLSNLLFGGGDKLRKQAAAERSRALTADPELNAAAQNFRRAYPNARPEEIMQILQSQGIAPNDMQALYSALTGQ